MIQFPHTTPVLKVEQPLGTFFVAVLSAELLLRVAESERLRAAMNETGEGYTLSGTQRMQQEKRFTEIANYIDRVDAAFPNSIILAANFEPGAAVDLDEAATIAEESGGSSAELTGAEWYVQQDGPHGWKLVIPTEKPVASIVDGQHRLEAFRKASAGRLDMQLVCSVFIDLPKPLQAQLFATINSTQKAVDRSITYELFGYNVSDQPESYWTPDKLSIFLTRKLATDDESVLRGRISVAPKKDDELTRLTKSGKWQVSTAVIVDGILRLVTSNPKRDSNLMRRKTAQHRQVLKDGPKDKSPLRDAFIEGNDSLIFRTVLNYTAACEAVFWSGAEPGSFITKTVGVQALFDILRKLAPEALEQRKISSGFFKSRLDGARDLDFSDAEYKSPSGSGRTKIRKAIEEKIDLQR
ncbi:DGQHR domain-containing protein [Bradyrhizobium sp. AUGA SZCCT0177]|uniref:DNA phosphorothioation-associated DGQHR protein 1 n=1 Tax=Bradyrhizobium sp. AUGA SZCCT0177 TaxID=2807665 RepID=UPI001BA940D8|nr:DNA phosphorothioation-associated DGQHR protein 1 [Bradyrhizobium sp. AUGA SZCCT0177]MBR1285362.1 DGQHR domain-containing protein [Bradyrhizobium sp. AUGA SZCCT0177]